MIGHYRPSILLHVSAIHVAVHMEVRYEGWVHKDIVEVC